MDRKFNLAVAQVGGIQPSEDRATAVQRLVRLLEQSHHQGATLPKASARTGSHRRSSST
jgi:hypothetical protein